MPQRKPYNPNSNYGRKKLREQAAEEFEKLTPAQKADRQAKGVLIFIIILAVVFLLFWLTGNPQGFVKWMSK